MIVAVHYCLSVRIDTNSCMNNVWSRVLCLLAWLNACSEISLPFLPAMKICSTTTVISHPFPSTCKSEWAHMALKRCIQMLVYLDGNHAGLYAFCLFCNAWPSLVVYLVGSKFLFRLFEDQTTLCSISFVAVESYSYGAEHNRWLRICSVCVQAARVVPVVWQNRCPTFRKV